MTDTLTTTPDTDTDSPYFGQAYWFTHIHPSPLPSAISRYQAETRRVLGVLEGVLGASTRSGGTEDSETERWLVGGKFTVADLAFVPYVPLSVFLRSSGTENGSGADADVPGGGGLFFV